MSIQQSPQRLLNGIRSTVEENLFLLHLLINPLPPILLTSNLPAPVYLALRLPNSTTSNIRENRTTVASTPSTNGWILEKDETLGRLSEEVGEDDNSGRASVAQLQYGCALCYLTDTWLTILCHIGIYGQWSVDSLLTQLFLFADKLETIAKRRHV